MSQEKLTQERAITAEKHLRKGLSISQVAELMGISENTVRRIKNGTHPMVSTDQASPEGIITNSDNPETLRGQVYELSERLRLKQEQLGRMDHRIVKYEEYLPQLIDFHRETLYIVRRIESYLKREARRQKDA